MKGVRKCTFCDINNYLMHKNENGRTESPSYFTLYESWGYILKCYKACFRFCNKCLSIFTFIYIYNLQYRSVIINNIIITSKLIHRQFGEDLLKWLKSTLIFVFWKYCLYIIVIIIRLYSMKKKSDLLDMLYNDCFVCDRWISLIM